MFVTCLSVLITSWQHEGLQDEHQKPTILLIVVTLILAMVTGGMFSIFLLESPICSGIIANSYMEQSLNILYPETDERFAGMTSKQKFVNHFYGKNALVRILPI